MLNTPALAQKADDSADVSSTMDREFGPRIESAFNVCVSDAAPDMTSVEARATAAGWPAFETIGNWRVVTLPPGDDVLLSFGFQAEPITDASIPGTALTCALLVPTQVQSVLIGHLRARFSTSHDLGIFYLDHGVLRELSTPYPDRGIPQLFEDAPQDQRVVLYTTETRGDMLAANITILHRAAGS